MSQLKANTFNTELKISTALKAGLHNLKQFKATTHIFPTGCMPTFALRLMKYKLLQWKKKHHKTQFSNHLNLRFVGNKLIFSSTLELDSCKNFSKFPPVSEKRCFFYWKSMLTMFVISPKQALHFLCQNKVFVFFFVPTFEKILQTAFPMLLFVHRWALQVNDITLYLSSF